jgi:hypothetical protein
MARDIDLSAGLTQDVPPCTVEHDRVAGRNVLHQRIAKLGGFNHRQNKPSSRFVSSTSLIREQYSAGTESGMWSRSPG